MKNIIIFIMYLIGLFMVSGVLFAAVPGSVKKAVKSRNNSTMTESKLLLLKISKALEKKIKLSREQSQKIQKYIIVLNLDVTAEYFVADIISNALFYAVMGIPFCILNIWLGLILVFALFDLSVYFQIKKLKKLLQKRKVEIEKELPQFAGTIRQQLTTTRDMVTILSTYQKISGDVLKNEITRTINDIKTTNTEHALQGLERRIGSSKLSEVVRGLIGVYHGEEQTMFFELLTDDLIKSQTETVIKELEQRPSKLTVNFIAIIALALAVALYAMSSSFNAGSLAWL